MSRTAPGRGSPTRPQPPERRRRRAFWFIAALLVPVLLMGGGTVIVGTLIPEVGAAYQSSIVATGKAPAFWLTLAFILTFGLVRLITYRIHAGTPGFFHDVTTKSGLHIHHMVPGMLLVLVSGYLGLVLPEPRPAEILAMLFGIGAALVLDEFALWLRLADVYWEPQGRESIDAVVLAGGIAIQFLLGRGFWSHLIEAVLRPLLALP